MTKMEIRKWQKDGKQYRMGRRSCVAQTSPAG
nr:MAG TPA: hypothetical protein [Caudoviricetes sp.]